jgi:hypothetical protein
LTTLIETINDVLRATKSFPVATWNDTDESRNVAYIVRRQLNQLIKKYPDAPSLKKIRELVAFADASFPTSFNIPDRVEDIYWIKYLQDSQYKEVHYMEPKVFIDRADMEDTTATNVQTIVINSVEVPIFNDRYPKYWTTFDNSVIIMDGFKSSVDTTLQESKSQAYVREKYEFAFENTYELPLDERLHSVLLEECISSAYVEFKGSVNPKAEAQARRGRILEQASQNTREWTAYGRF